MEYVRFGKKGSFLPIDFHGVTPHPIHFNFIFLSSAGSFQPGIHVANMDTIEENPIHLETEYCERWHAKDVHFVNGNTMVALFVNGRPQLSFNNFTYYDSRIVIFELLHFPWNGESKPRLRYIDGIDLLDCQIDSCTVLSDSSILVTQQQSKINRATILQLRLDTHLKKLKLVSNYSVDPFPHSIAYRDGIVAYTSYKSSKLFIQHEQDFAHNNH